MGNADSAERLPMSDPINQLRRVQLAATPLVPYVPSMAQAYHTSIAVDNVELSFSRKGICTAHSFESHSHLSQGPPHIVDLGTSPMGIPELKSALKPFFKKDEYDLLRKNCNSFSDCAIFYLLGKRLDSKYCELERIGKSVEQAMGLIRILSLGDYKPNPEADGFDVEEVVKTLACREEDEEVVKMPVCRKKPRTTLTKQCKLTTHVKAKEGTHVKAKEKSTKGYKPGMHVEVFSRTHRAWVGATVSGVNKTGTVTVLYANGQQQREVPVKELATALRTLKTP